MKGIGVFMCTLLVIDTFAASYYVGMHSRTVPIEDPKLPPFVKKVEAPVTVPAAKPVEQKKTEPTSKSQTKTSSTEKKKAVKASKAGRHGSANPTTKSTHH